MRIIHKSIEQTTGICILGEWEYLRNALGRLTDLFMFYHLAESNYNNGTNYNPDNLGDGVPISMVYGYTTTVGLEIIHFL